MKTIWEFGLKGARSVTQRPPIIFDDQVIVTFNHGLGANFQGTLVALDLATGVEKWRFNQPHFFAEPTVTGDGSCLVTSFNGQAHKLQRDGQLAWTTKLSERNIWSGSLEDGLFIVSEIAGGSKMTRAIDAEKGRIVWEYENGGHSYGTTRAATQSIVLTNAKGGSDTQSYDLHCVDLQTGKEVWETQSFDILFNPVSLDGLIIVGSRNKILAFDQTNGDLVSTYDMQTGATFRDNPVVNKNMTIWASKEGHLIALEATKKKRLIRKNAHDLTLIWDTQFDSDIEYLTQGCREVLVLTKSGICHKVDTLSGHITAQFKLPRYKSGMGIVEIEDGLLLASINRNCALLKL